jgi:hypothetical protein
MMPPKLYSLLLLLVLAVPCFSDEALEVKVSQVSFLLADTAELTPVNNRVQITTTNLDAQRYYGLRIEVVNQVHNYIAAYPIIDEVKNLVSFPPIYLNPVLPNGNTYNLTGDPGSAYWLEVRSNSAPVVTKVRIEGTTTEPTPVDPEPPVDTGDFEQLERDMKTIVSQINEPVVQTALYNALTNFSPETTLEATVSKFVTIQQNTLRVLGQQNKIKKDWFNQFTVPLDTKLFNLQSAGKIQSATDFTNAVKAIHSALKPQTASILIPDKPTSYIKLYTSATCSICEQWKREVYPSLQKKGWGLTEIYTHNYPKPSFEICTNDKCSSRYEGYMTLQQITEVVNSLRE